MNKFYLRLVAAIAVGAVCSLLALTISGSKINNNIGVNKSVVKATSFNMKTGYYVGGYTDMSITGIGFQPDLLFIKADTGAINGMVFRTKDMANSSAAYLGTVAANASGVVTTLDSDGFTIPASYTANTTGVVNQYIAFKEGDGSMKVGTYTGNGTDNRLISGLGFQPDLVVIKGDAATAAVWRSSSMTGDIAQYFSASAEAANLIQAFGPDGFQVGTDASVNTDGTTYYYFAFKTLASSMAVGTYTGNGVDDRQITGVGFQPNWMFTKQTGAQEAIQRSGQLSGDTSSFFSGTLIATDHIQSLDADGFELGTNAKVNADAQTYYYAAFYEPMASVPAGTFSMRSGYYVGSAAALSISGLGIEPDLVLVKSSKASVASFRTSLQKGDSSLVFGGTATVSGYVTSLDSDGFGIGTNAAVNTITDLYQYVAFSGSGSTNFKIGAYTGTGEDSRTINGVGFQPDLVWIKRDGASSAVWRTSATSSDWSDYFEATNGGADYVQSLAADGFQVGTNIRVNSAGDTYHYVAFKSTAGSMAVGSYTGDGSDSRNITGLDFQPDLVFTKLTTGGTPQAAIQRTDQEHGDASGTFTAAAIAQNKIQGLGVAGFQVGTDASVNTNASVYHYVAFGGTPAPATPTGNYYLKTGTYTGTGVAFSVSGLGFQPDLILIKDVSTGVGVFKTKYMVGDRTSVFASGGSLFTGGITSIDSDGFTVGTNASVNTNLRVANWYAFGNSGCANFKVGSYASNGAGDNRSIAGVGFQPDLVTVNAASSRLAGLNVSSLAGDNSLRFHNAVSASDMIQALESDGFQVGTNASTNNTAAGTTHHYFAFKELANYFDVGSYTGNGGDDRTIDTPGFQPNVVWVKNAAANYAMQRTDQSSAGNAQYFSAVADAADMIQGFGTSGFQIGTNATVNTADVVYYYSAWKIVPEDLQQIHYRWRADDGTETSATYLANEDTEITSVVKETAKRLRLQISNEGSSSTSTALRLEYGIETSTCAAIESWTLVPVSATTEHWEMMASDNLTDDNPTTNISGGLTDANATFIAGKLKDTTNQSTAITITPVKFTEMEYSITATTNATNGGVYCFRLTNSGDRTNFTYSSYPKATLAAPAIAISLSTDGVVGFGSVNVDTTVSTTAAQAETVSVDTGPVNLTIQSTNFTTSTYTWTLGGANGSNIVKFEFATSTNALWTTFANSASSYTLDSNVTQGSTRDIRFQLTMPTVTDSYSQYGSTITITASAP